MYTKLQVDYMISYFFTYTIGKGVLDHLQKVDEQEDRELPK